MAWIPTTYAQRGAQCWIAGRLHAGVGISEQVSPRRLTPLCCLRRPYGVMPQRLVHRERRGCE